jgi:hypothetical protein
MEDKANYHMGWKDEMGYQYEINQVLPTLLEAGFGQYIINHNPTDYYQWGHTRTVGIDLEMKVGSYTLCIEVSYCSKQYHYRRKWFTKCRIPRFKHCPLPNSQTYWIVLTNRPENFNPVKEIADQFSISVMGLDGLINLISNLQSSKLQSNLKSTLTNSICTNH